MKNVEVSLKLRTKLSWIDNGDIYRGSLKTSLNTMWEVSSSYGPYSVTFQVKLTDSSLKPSSFYLSSAGIMYMSITVEFSHSKSMNSVSIGVVNLAFNSPRAVISYT